jgi:hypothetical protein
MMGLDTFKALESLLMSTTERIGSGPNTLIRGPFFIQGDIQEVLDAYRRIDRHGDEWQQYVQGRLKLLDEVKTRRQVVRSVKRWMIKSHLLKDRKDFRRP